MVKNAKDEVKTNPIFVVTCGDEGVQVNEGVRLGFVGAGVNLKNFAKVTKVLEKMLDSQLRIASSEECDWVKAELKLSDWEQTNASVQQHTESLADETGLLYAGYLPFKDPRKLKHDIKGHMVRPHNIHVANKICFTLGGGEQVYNLSCYLISADWVSGVSSKIAKEMIKTQVEFYKKVSKNNHLQIIFEKNGILGEKIAKKNEKVLRKMGIEPDEVRERAVD